MLTRWHHTIFPRRLPRYLIIQEAPSVLRARRRQRTALGIVLLLLSGMLAGVQLANAQNQQELPLMAASDIEGSLVTMADVGAGTLLFKTQRAGRYTPALSQSSNADIHVHGMTARVVLSQQFKNHTDQWQEGIYTFPLPDNAAVNAMRIVIGDRIIEGEIAEKQKARKIYNKAKASGKKASLVEQQRPNMFTNSVANIGPGEEVRVEITYLQAIAFQSGQFSLRLPMTVTPRYMPGKPLSELSQGDELYDSALSRTVQTNTATGWAQNTSEVLDAALISPPQMPPGANQRPGGNTMHIQGTLDLGMSLRSINSAYHQIALSRTGNSYEFSLSDTSVSMTQDFVLNWRPQLGNEPEAAVFTEAIGDDSYATLMLLPPQAQAGGSATPMHKEQIFIIDTSGSMGGVSIEQARASLSSALNRLNENDWFNIIEFDSNTRLFSPIPVQANIHNLARALRMVNSLQADGGTEMLPALQAAMRHNSSAAHGREDGRLRQIVFITDGAVGNEQALFAAIHQQLGNSRLFMVGIGSAPNSHFMRKASQFGRGTFTHIGDVNEVSEKMQALFSKLESPAVSNLRIEWPSGIQTEDYPAMLPDLYHGEPLVLSSKISGGLPEGSELNVLITGEASHTAWQRELKVSATAKAHEGTATVWARRKIASLLDQQVMTGKSARNEVLPLALEHKLLSPFTSFVAVEKQRSRPAAEPLDSNALANAKPKGQTPQQFAFPKGSTSARVSFAWSVLLLLMLAVIRRSMNAEQRYVLSV